MSIKDHYLTDILAGMDFIRKGGAGDYPKFHDYIEALNDYLASKGLNEGERERLVYFYSQDAGNFKQ
jgi:dsDNA-binding SOS-regulon protein